MEENQEKKNIVGENYEDKNKVYSNLTKEQNDILQKINDLLIFDKDDPDCYKKFSLKQKAVMDFELELKKEGIEPENYLLFHRIAVSTPLDVISEFDINGKIQKFIEDFYTEYELKKKQK